MKIKIAFIGPHNNNGIGGGDRKFGIYYNNLNENYFEKYFLYITKDTNLVSKDKNIILESDIIDFLESKKIDYVYFSGAKLGKETENEIINKYVSIINVNFTPCYREHPHILNFIISKTDYQKLKFIHNALKNSYVVYNPIDFHNWTRLSKTTNEDYRKCFENKKFIIGRLGRAEPSKWNYLIIATLLKLQKRKDYSYGFIFAGMPLLYRKALKFLLNKKMYKSILFLPELRELGEIAKFYKSIDIFWQTSWIGESFGNVIAESFCFNVPVITDYKDFYNNGKIKEKLYDAQIELVDNEINGGYCAYPDSIISFLESHTLKEIKSMGKMGYNKVQNVYDIKITSNTMAKILYDYGRNHLSYQYDENLEKLQQIPNINEIKDYENEYFDRIRECYKYNSISHTDRIIYNFFGKIWRLIEYIYLIYRKASKNFLKKDIEKDLILSKQK